MAYVHWNAVQFALISLFLSTIQGIVLPDDWISPRQLSRVKRPPILTTVNCGYLPMAENLWHHYTRLQRQQHLLFIAEDYAAYEQLLLVVGKAHVLRPMRETNLTEQANFDSPAFNKIAALRIYYLRWFVQRNMRVIYQDLDIVFLQDPLKYVPLNAWDLVLTNDGEPSHQYKQLCSCFISLHPSVNTLNFLENWKNETEKEVNGKMVQDQYSLNNVLSQLRLQEYQFKDLSLLVLPIYMFPPGNRWDTFKSTAVWYHANWMVGFHAKRAAIQKRGLWLANTTFTC